MDRRTVLTGLGIAGLGGPAMEASGTPRSMVSQGNVALSPRYKYPGVDGRSLINRPRAYAVMEELGIDGLIALNPINVYYLANTIPVMTKFRVDFAGFATFPRDPQQPGFLVAGAPQALEMASGEREVPPLIAVTQASNWTDYVNATPEQMRIEPRVDLPGSDLRTINWVGGFAVKESGPYTDHEQAWIAAQKHSILHSEPTAAWALARALKESGPSHGRLAVDDLRIAGILESVGMTEVTCVPGDKIFQRIRMVKSETELALQRIGGHNNAVAAMNTIRAIERGMTFREIERRFNTEAAALGSESQSFIAGVSLALLPDGITVPGKPFLIDAVSHFGQYHGDFGRTVVIGEPSKEVLARERAHRIGRDAVFEIVRPGVRFSELRRVAKEAQVKAGMPEQIAIVVAHCVGLTHNDDPSHYAVPFNAPYDHVLEENMVLTIDLASVEIGWGACLHEDLFRVTNTGFEYLAPPGDPLVVV